MLLWGIPLLSLAIGGWLCCAGNAFDGLAWLWMLPLSVVGAFLALAVLAFLFLWGMCAVVDQSKPQEDDSRFYRFVIQQYIHAVFTLMGVHIHKQGVEQVPKNGRFLLVCNHMDNVDPVVLLAAFPQSQLAFIGKKETASMFLVGKAMHKLLCQSINRENDKEALKTIIKCVRLLQEDKVSVGVFPEGYIHPDHKLHHFRHGVFKIATKAKVPVVVCTMKNTRQVIPNLLHFRPSNVQLHVLKVFAPEEFAGMTTVELSEQVYHLMAQDLGPELVHQDSDENETAT